MSAMKPCHYREYVPEPAAGVCVSARVGVPQGESVSTPRRMYLISSDAKESALSFLFSTVVPIQGYSRLFCDWILCLEHPGTGFCAWNT